MNVVKFKEVIRILIEGYLLFVILVRFLNGALFMWYSLNRLLILVSLFGGFVGFCFFGHVINMKLNYSLNDLYTETKQKNKKVGKSNDQQN